MLGADVVVAELEGLAQAELEDLLGARRERDVAGRLLLTLADDVLDLLADGVQRDTERFQSLCGDTLTLVDQAEQDVLRPDVVVVEHLGLFLGQDDDAPSAVGESLEHVYSSRRRCRVGADTSRVTAASRAAEACSLEALRRVSRAARRS